jgi:hypothetical protein
MNDKKRIRTHVCLLYYIGNEKLIKKNSEEMRCSLNVGLMNTKIGLLFGIKNVLADYLQEYSHILC